MFHKVTLSSHDLLSLSVKKEYIHKMYTNHNARYSGDKYRLGLVQKFNNSLGFKPLTDTVRETGVVDRAHVELPEGYMTPRDYLFEKMRTPVESFDILVFYIPDVQVEHPEEKYAYHTSVIATKWTNFLKKVFPHLEVSHTMVEEVPKQSLRDFAFEYFYSSMDKKLNCTIEFSSAEILSEEDIKYMIPKIELLSQDKLGVRQFRCSTCEEYSDGKKPYHIEIVYLTWYGKELSDEQLEEQMPYITA